MNDRPKSSARQQGDDQWAEMTKAAKGTKKPIMRIDTERLPEEIEETLSDLLLALQAYGRAQDERRDRDRAILNTVPRLAEVAERAGVYLDMLWSAHKRRVSRRRR